MDFETDQFGHSFGMGPMDLMEYNTVLADTSPAMGYGKPPQYVLKAEDPLMIPQRMVSAPQEKSYTETQNREYEIWFVFFIIVLLLVYLCYLVVEANKSIAELKGLLSFKKEDT
jgi:hypothetical protein